MSQATKAGYGGEETAGTRTTESMIVQSRFCGPPGSGNGGYVCGRIAAYVDGPVTVTLRRPAPLARPLAVERDGEGSVRVYDGSTLTAEAISSPGSPALQIPGLVSMQEACAAAGRGRYYTDPVFGDCFVCGPGRGPGDGLRIFPGPVAGQQMWAAPWTPDPSVTGAGGRVRPEVVWAALDCPSGIAAGEAAGLAFDTAILLGRMTASLTGLPSTGPPSTGLPSTGLPSAGDQCRVLAWPGTRDGRKLSAGSALIGHCGELLATASTVWIAVPRAVLELADEGVS